MSTPHSAYDVELLTEAEMQSLGIENEDGLGDHVFYYGDDFVDPRNIIPASASIEGVI